MTTKIENKEQFINENINVVPKNKMKNFKTLDIDAQVDKIKFYIDMKHAREEWLEKNKLVNRLKDMFTKRHGTVDDAKQCMDFLQEFIDTAKQREINKIDEEIAKLQQLKDSLKD